MKWLLLALLFVFALMSATSQTLWPEALPEPVVKLVDRLVLPDPLPADQQESPYTPTIYEMKNALLYQSGYRLLYGYVNESLIPYVNQLGEQYNRLVFRNKLLLVGGLFLAGTTATSLLLLAGR